MASSSSSFHYPGETCRHIATILGFPSRCSLPPKHHQAACREIIDLAVTIAEFEPVRLHASLENVQLAESMMKEDSRFPRRFSIDVLPVPTNHLWVRDTAPVYVCKRSNDTGAVDKKRYAVNFNFNEWGQGKMSNGTATSHDEMWPGMNTDALHDNHVFSKRVIAQDTRLSSVEAIDSRLCLEGGALVYDGEGTLIVSESSLIGADRNPGWSKADVEAELMRQLGATKVIWFKGIKGLDLTDVHADAELSFIRPGVVVMSRPHENCPPKWRQGWFQVYKQVQHMLSTETDAKGRTFEVHVLPEPDPSVTNYSPLHEDPATNYVNFYFVDGGVILPQFGDEEADARALRTMQQLCPDRVVRQVYVNALPLTGGVIHCATQPVVHVDSLI